ncbi:uncharacterized protein LOC113239749 [Hyposmocoma kahamanoa]|uniref:uncharacterized protein LOC113239749 n=1 Tax=Hyposmocoma kahamanoa TaxID=1477025 RepID=UPI000E6D83C8|nr:uncharacterized protein LOC113239749 [Hyposmocoma kahamanoa]
MEIPKVDTPCDICICEALLEDKLASKEPFGLFEFWHREACNNDEVINPDAMCLSTATPEGVPSARIVQLQGHDKNGFRFYTSSESQKGRELEENPNVALTFYWPAQQRSVRIEGRAQMLPKAEAATFFQSRPLDTQITSHVSKQSTPLADRAELWRQHIDMAKKFESGGVVPVPKTWRGYTVIPRTVEFCQARKNRLSDRIRFRRPNPSEVIDGHIVHPGIDGWVFERLAP